MFDLYSNLSAPKAGGANVTTTQTTTDAKPAAGWSSTSKFLASAGGGEKISNMPSVLAQNALLKRKRLQQPQPPKVARTPMMVAQAKIKEEITTPHLQQTAVTSAPLKPGVSEPPASRMGSTALVAPKDVDEYDPARPNDYEEYRNERQARAQRREMERQQRDMERQQRQQQRDFQPSVPMDEDDYPPPRTSHRHSPPPPPLQQSRQARESSPPPSASTGGKIDLHISGEEAWRRRAQLSAAPAPAMAPMTAHDPYGYEAEELPTRPPSGPRVSNQIAPPSFDSPAPTPTPTKGPGLSVAEQMMKKMGWKEGRGLGREGQGILNPLEHKKLKGKGPASGVIVDTNSQLGNLSKRRKVESSKVVLLRNMVGPGEVDEDLESETAEECTKFGPVVRCKIYEEKNPMVPPEKAVRIFVQFTTLESAIKGTLQDVTAWPYGVGTEDEERSTCCACACLVCVGRLTFLCYHLPLLHHSSPCAAVNGLNGRFFAKRQVEAIFFDEERLEHGDLASHPDEY